MTDEQHAILTKRAKGQGISAYVKSLIEKDIADFPQSPEWGENLLGNQYKTWLHEQTQPWDYDPSSDQDGVYSYSWWLENVHKKA
jgi:hypothetical protein